MTIGVKNVVEKRVRNSVSPWSPLDVTDMTRGGHQFEKINNVEWY